MLELGGYLHWKEVQDAHANVSIAKSLRTFTGPFGADLSIHSSFPRIFGPFCTQSSISDRLFGTETHSLLAVLHTCFIACYGTASCFQATLMV
jgi:hypothetical protein